MEEYTDEQVAQDIFATLDSIGIVERVRLIAESDRTDDQKDNLSRNERHIQLKMKKDKFVKGLTKTQADRISALALPSL
tara:strand:+ start:2212 stop:2448 length:237 start_codon:yes stop_codon:yes gene_type:complete